MSDSLEEPDRTNATRLFAAVSHDLRQPLQALGLWTSALKARINEPALIKIVDRIDASVESLGEMLGTLTEYSRIDAGVIKPEFTSVPIDAMLDRARSQWSGQAQSKGLRMAVRHCGLQVRSDATQLGRILHHLISNAVRFTDTGTILLCARKTGSTVRIEVRDSGRGIAMPLHALVFEPFQRAPKIGGDQDRGLGLGLAIVRGLCDLLAHRCALRSAPARGSVFSISAPPADPDQGPADAPAA